MHDQGIVNQVDMEMSAEEAYQARLRRSQMIMGVTGEPQVVKGDNKIKKMMEAMGWKGKGLGKQEQGILNPLVAMKTDATGGLIVES